MMVLTPRLPTMPNPAEVKARLPPKDKEQLDVSRLRLILHNEHSKPNILTTAELNYFSDLFKFHSDKIVQEVGGQPHVDRDLDIRVRQLTKEYLRKVDMYKETHVVSPEGEVIMRMPPIFVQVETLESNPENDNAVLSNRKFNRSDIPRFSTEALARLSEALNKQQRSETHEKEVAAAREHAHKLLDAFYGRGDVTAAINSETKNDDHFVEDKPSLFSDTGCIDL